MSTAGRDVSVALRARTRAKGAVEFEFPDELVEEIVERVLERIGTVAESEFLTIEEAAKLLRAKPQRVYDLCSDGRLQRYKDGSRTLVSRAEIVAHLLPSGSRSRVGSGVAA